MVLEPPLLSLQAHVVFRWFGSSRHHTVQGGGRTQAGGACPGSRGFKAPGNHRGLDSVGRVATVLITTCGAGQSSGCCAGGRKVRILGPVPTPGLPPVPRPVMGLGSALF